MPAKVNKQVRLPTKSIATIFGSTQASGGDAIGQSQDQGSQSKLLNKLFVGGMVVLLVSLFITGLVKGGGLTDTFILLPIIGLGLMYYKKDKVVEIWHGGAIF